MTDEQLKIRKALFALNDLTLEQIDKVVKEIKTLKIKRKMQNNLEK